MIRLLAGYNGQREALVLVGIVSAGDSVKRAVRAIKLAAVAYLEKRHDLFSLGRRGFEEGKNPFYGWRSECMN